MPIKIESTHLGDVRVLAAEVHEDERGFFLESYRSDRFQGLGLPTWFVQDDHCGSVRNVVRGLHFQWDPPMGKLVRVTHGAAWLVAVDIRPGSPTLGGWFGIRIHAEDHRQVWAPAGFARGFCALSDWAEIQCKCTGTSNAARKSVIRWDDPAIGIAWPVREPILGAGDADAQTLAEWLERPEAEFFRYHRPPRPEAVPESLHA